jgi:hypothetical protein
VITVPTTPPSLPEPFEEILSNVKEGGRTKYFSGMIKHASVCEYKHGSAVIRLGISGDKGMANYWVMYLDTQSSSRVSYNAYSYMDNKFGEDGHGPPRENGTWTSEHITLKELLEWILMGGVA